MQYENAIRSDSNVDTMEILDYEAVANIRSELKLMKLKGTKKEK